MNEGAHYSCSLQENINNLAGCLEQVLQKLKTDHSDQLSRQDIQDVYKVFTSALDHLALAHKKRTEVLEHEIAYLKEMVTSQRMMMEDYAEHLKELEARHTIDNHKEGSSI